jgi:hypothetical protein
MFKKCKVVMLPTNKAILGGICKQVSSSMSLRDKDINKIFKVVNDIWVNRYNDGDTDELVLDFVPINLYIVSDEEIKDNTWYLDLIDGVKFASKFFNWSTMDSTARKMFSKIIATTDNLLTIKEYTGVVDESNGVKEHWDNKLPSPSQSFIDKYISEYNKGNIIEDIMVEYESTIKRDYEEHDGEYAEIPVYPKVSKDNTITIKRVKDSWSRKEVKSLVIDGMRFMNSYIINHDTLHGQVAKQVANNWIEENL